MTNKVSPSSFTLFPLQLPSLPVRSLFSAFTKKPDPIPPPFTPYFLPGIPKNHPLRNTVDSNIVGHEADFLLAGSRLQGSTVEKQVEHLHAFVQLCKEHALCSFDTIERIENFLSSFICTTTKEALGKGIPRLSQEIASKVHRLQEGESISIEGSWTEKLSDDSLTGHALVFTFTKKSQGLYDIYIFNTGDDCLRFHDHKIIETGIELKTAVCPYVKFQDVDPSYLGFSQGFADPGFFAKLLQTNQIYTDKEKERSPSEKIYTTRQGFGAMHGHRVKADENTPYMTPQRAGTCALSVLFAALYPLFTSGEEYKLFKFWLKYVDLVILFEKMQEGQSDQETRYLLCMQAKKLLRGLEKRSALFSPTLLQSLQNKLSSIIHRLEDIPSSEIQADSPVVQANLDEGTVDFQYKFPPYKIVLEKTTTSKYFATKKTFSIQMLYSDLSRIDKLESGPLKLYAIEEIARFLLTLEPSDIELVSLHQIKPLVQLLRQVIQEYLSSLKIERVKDPIPRNTAWIFTLTAYQLTCRISPRLGEYTIAHDPLLQDRDKELYIEYSPTESHALDMIVSKLEASSSPRKQLFDFFKYLDMETDLSGHKKLPSEAGWFTDLAYPGASDVSYKEQLELLIKAGPLNETMEGELLVYLRDMAFWANLCCSSAQYQDPLLFGQIYPVDLYFFVDQSYIFKQYKIYDHIDFSRSSKKAWTSLWESEAKKEDTTTDAPMGMWESAYAYFTPKEKTFSTLELENVLLSSPEKHPFSGKIPPATCGSATLRASKLIHFISHNIHLLKDPIEQTKVLHLLFQSLPGRKPVVGEALQDPSFVQQLRDCISQGIHTFSTDWLSKKPDILSSLFFVRLQRRVQHLQPSLSFCEAKTLLNMWLNRKDLSDEERSLLHMHRIAQYIPIPIENISKEELREIFASWIGCKEFIPTDMGDGIYQQQEIFRFIGSLSAKVEKLTGEDLTVILTSITDKSAEDLPPSSNWRPSSCLGEYINYPWTISLLEGLAKNTWGSFRLGYRPDITSYPRYRDLFGSNALPINEEDDAYTFQDPRTKLLFRYGKKHHPKTLEVLYEGSWYACGAATPDSNTPSILISDYLCFYTESHRLYLHRISGKPTFVTHQKTFTLQEVLTGNTILIPLRTSCLDLFEPSNWRLHEVDPSRRSLIRFPRFRDHAGAELCLVENSSGTLYLEGYPDYILVEPVQGILGSLETMLCFRHQKTGDIKILVPHLPAKTHELFPTSSLHTDLDVKDTQQIGTRTYVEYTYSGGKIVCKNLESKAFLSYLYLTQHREKESLELLESLSQDIPLSRVSLDSLARIMHFHHTPAAVAIALRAALRIKTFLLNAQNKKQLEELEEFLSFLFHTRYRQTYNNIPASLRLSAKELQTLPFSPHPTPRQKLVSPTWKASYNNSSNNFDALYEKLYLAKSAQERRRILATSSAALDDLETDLRSIIARVENLDGPIPSPHNGAEINHYQWASNTLRALGPLGFLPYTHTGSLLPPKGNIQNTDRKIPKGGYLKPLSQGILESLRPSYSFRTFIPGQSISATVAMQAIFARYFTQVLDPSSIFQDPIVAPKDINLAHEHLIEQGFVKINTEMAQQAKLAAHRTSIRLQDKSTVEMVQGQIQMLRLGIERGLREEKNRILSLCNAPPQDPALAKQFLRLCESGSIEAVTWDLVVSAYLQGSYTHLNPHIPQATWEAIDLAVQRTLVESTYLHQIQRALAEEDPHKLGVILQETLSYIPSKDRKERAYLVYEYRSGHRIRKPQIEAIETLLSQNSCVLQMMMGGGKTTVLTSILLELLPKETIPFFISLPAQFETQVANLDQLQYKHFKKHIIPLQVTRSDLTLEKLQWILKKLTQSMQSKEPIVTTASTLQCLQLEWIFLLDQNRRNISSTDAARLSSLTEILRKIKGHATAIFDEVDQILDIFTEHNFPLGSKETIPLAYTELMQKIIELHLDPEIENKLGLLQGNQASYPQKHYAEEILPLVAKRLFFAYLDKLSLEETDLEAFLRYVLQGEETPAWRERLESTIDRESAQLIFLAKGVFSQILPIVMTRTVNKNYGTLPNSQDRRVIPFEGVNCPASTQFSGPYEASLYHFLAALSSPITKIQIQALASHWIAGLIPILGYGSMDLTQTPEYIKFFELTGAALDKVYLGDIQEIEKAHQHLLGSPKSRLEIEKEFIQKHVGIYTEFYSAGPQNLVSMFQHAKGLTGTPYNSFTYAEKLRTNVFRSTDVESKIRMALLARSDAGQSKVYFTPSNDVQTTLEHALKNNPRKKDFHALLDPIGFFKDFSNKQVAQEILSYFEDDPRVEYVLFFGRTAGDAGIPGTPMVLKKPSHTGGDCIVEVLEGTHKESLLAKGIDPAKLLSFYDEKHCEATDIPHVDHALGLIVAGIGLLDRDLLQTMLRLRGYLQSQDIDIILPEKERDNYPQDPTCRDILTQAEATELSILAGQGITSTLQKVDAIYRDKSIDMLLRFPFHTIASTLRSALVSTQSMDPYEIFGRPGTLKSPIEVLSVKQHKEKLKHPSALQGISTKEALHNLGRELEQNLSKLPKLVPTSDIPHGMEIEMIAEQEIAIENELEIEYQSYQQGIGIPFVEKAKPRIFTPSALLSCMGVKYKKPYHTIFTDSPFTVTENFAYTQTRLLPIFSQKQKPADQILIIEDDLGLRVSLLSTEEGEKYKEKIEQGEKNMWLYLPDGHLHVTSSQGAAPQDTEKLQEVFFAVNLFQGNMQYLLQHKERLIEKIEKNPSLKEIILDFLALKSLQHPTEKGAFVRIRKELSALQSSKEPLAKLAHFPTTLDHLWTQLLDTLEVLLEMVLQGFYALHYYRNPPYWEKV